MPYSCPSDTHTFSYSRNTYEGSNLYPGTSGSGDPATTADIQDPTKFLDLFESPGSGIQKAQWGQKNSPPIPVNEAWKHSMDAT